MHGRGWLVKEDKERISGRIKDNTQGGGGCGGGGGKDRRMGGRTNIARRGLVSRQRFIVEDGKGRERKERG